MIFNFFQKHAKQNEVREHLGGFQDEFSTQQKKAVLLSLFLIANSDGEFHRKEIQFFEQTANLLGYRLHDGFVNEIDEFMSMGRDSVYRILNTLNENQKDWYIITVVGMVHADGQALEKEFQFMEAFLERMGITMERFENVLKKTQLLAEKFM